jgi:hypothetical protein
MDQTKRAAARRWKTKSRNGCLPAQVSKLRKTSHGRVLTKICVSSAPSSVPNFATVTGRRKLFPLAILQSTRTNPFKSEKRKYPIYFDYAYQVEDKITWSLPEGFQVEALPSGYDYQNNYFRYHTAITPGPSELAFQRVTSLNGFIFDVGSYRLIKTSFEQMIGNDNKQVVLRQSPPKS